MADFESWQVPRDNVGVGLNKAEGPVKMEVRVLLPLPRAPRGYRQPTLGAAMAACGTQGAKQGLQF